MHVMNGIELTGSQYRELARIVGAGEPVGVTVGIVHHSLYDLGLLNFSSEGGRLTVEPTDTGRDFVLDVQEAEAEKRKTLMSDRRFQIGLSVATLLLSTALSWVSGCVSARWEASRQATAPAASQAPQGQPATP